LLGAAAEQLRNKLDVILDGTFLTRESRARAIDLAQKLGAAAVIIHCQCPLDVAIERVRDRGATASEIRPEFLSRQREQDEADDAGWPVCRVDTTAGLVAARQVVDGKLRAVLGL
jgi:predicted kinase